MYQNPTKTLSKSYEQFRYTIYVYLKTTHIRLRIPLPIPLPLRLPLRLRIRLPLRL